MRTSADDTRPSTNKLAQPIPFTCLHEEEARPYDCAAEFPTVPCGGAVAGVEYDTFEAWVCADTEEGGVPHSGEGGYEGV
jgi:hypothetical protein